MAPWSLVLVAALAAAAVSADEPAAPDPMAVEDAGLGDGAECSLSMLQRRSQQLSVPAGVPPPPADEVVMAQQLEASGNYWPKAATHFVWNTDFGYCLSADGNRKGNGVKIQLWRCDNSWKSMGQNFYIDGNGRIKLFEDPTYCMVIDGDRLQNGAKIQLWKCDENNANQAWRFRYSGQVKSQQQEFTAPMCLVIDGNHAFNGAKIQLWSCGTSGAAKAQEWVQVALSAHSAMIFAVPNAAKACPAPWQPVGDKDTCIAAAEAMKPGQGCYYRTPRTWAGAFMMVDNPKCPKGCSFYGACQGGCSLDLNLNGITDPMRACPDNGHCFSNDNICWLPL